MSGFTTEAKVGVFVLVALGLLAYMSYQVGGFKMKSERGYPLSAVFDTAAGLRVDGPVQIAGIKIGRITGIRLEGRRARINMQINESVKLPVDSEAMIRTQGVLGDKFIEISPGTSGTPTIESGGVLTFTQSPTDVDQVINEIAGVAKDIRRVTGSLGDVLGGPEGTAELKRILANFAEMSDNLARLTRDNQEQLNRMIANLAGFAQEIQYLTASNRENISAILLTFKEASENMNRTIASLSDISAKINQGQGTLGKLVNDDETVRDLNATLASLRDISDKINQGQGTLGKLVNDKDTGEKLDEAIDGINTYLAKEQAYKVYLDYHADYLFEPNKFKHTINARIQPNDDRFYLLGLVMDPRGSYSITDKTVTWNGQPTYIREETWDYNDIKFNAQIARRYYDFVFRGGMIESGGGIGIDYYMLGDDLKFTFEAFSGDFEHNPHLRAGAEYNFWEIFYLTAGYDDFISDQGRASPYVGLGLTFNEDDLKYILRSVPIPGS